MSTDTLRAALAQALAALATCNSNDGDDPWFDHEKVYAAREAARAALAQPASAALAQQPAASAAPAFDAEGFRAWVLRELPDDTIIGKGAWWADHLAKGAKWFIKPGSTPPAASGEAVATYCGHRLTPEGTQEFWGFAEKPLPPGTKLYAAPQPPAAPAPAVVPSELDVRRIMLAVVPGDDGMGLEVFANNVDDVVERLSDMGERLADLEDAPAPAQRERLTYAQIADIVLRVVYEGNASTPHRDAWASEIGIPFARAIEAAHGITAAPAARRRGKHD
jgi:hypothetical protein